jgi:hypothetical protein
MEVSTSTTHNSNKRQTSTPLAGFEAAIPASKRRPWPQILRPSESAVIFFEIIIEHNSRHKAICKSYKKGKNTRKLLCRDVYNDVWVIGLTESFVFKYWKYK